MSGLFACVVRACSLVFMQSSACLGWVWEMLECIHVQSALSESNLHKLNGRLGRGSVWVLFSVFCFFFFFLPFMGRIFSGSGLFLRSRQTRLRQS